MTTLSDVATKIQPTLLQRRVPAGKNSFLIEDLFIIPFRNFYVMIDIEALESYFSTVKLGHVTERTSE